MLVFRVYWGNLIPSLQHTGYADALMSINLRPLVTSGNGGNKTISRKSWTVSDDFKIFTLKLIPEKGFQ